MKVNSKIILMACVFVFGFAQSGLAQQSRAKLRNFTAGKKAMELYRAGKYEDSAKLFKQILAKNQQSMIAKEMLAMIGFKTKNPEMAQKFARWALKQDNRSVRAHFVMAAVYREKGIRLAALDHYRKAKKYASKPDDKEFIREHVLNLERPQRGEQLISATEIADAGLSAGKPYIAVFVFEESGADSNGHLGQTVAEMMITALLQTDRFTVFERGQLDKILDEQALGLSGALDTETAVDVGQLIGVDAVLAGSCSRLGKGIELDARIVQAHSAEIKIAANGSARSEQDLRQAVEDLAQKLAAGSEKIEQRTGDEKVE